MLYRYDLTIRSTDNGNPPLFMEKVITVTLTDVNEKPTSIQVRCYDHCLPFSDT